MSVLVVHRNGMDFAAFSGLKYRCLWWFHGQSTVMSLQKPIDFVLDLYFQINCIVMYVSLCDDYI